MISSASHPAQVFDRPTVRLKPKANARGLRRGFPWVYDSDLVTDRRTRALLPGSLALLEDGERAPLGLVTVNPQSKIICRMLDTDPNAQIDTAWFAARIAAAQDMRARIYDAPFYRLIHAEADGLPVFDDRILHGLEAGLYFLESRLGILRVSGDFYFNLVCHRPLVVPP